MSEKGATGPPQPPSGNFYNPPPYSEVPPVHPDVERQPGMATFIAVAPSLGPEPVNVHCTNCYADVVTVIKPVAGTLTWIVCLTCLLFGFWLGCCFIPFCVPALMDIEHHCPQCNSLLGTYRRM